MPVVPLSQWNGEFTIDNVRLQKDNLNSSAVTPPITFVTGLSKVLDTDADRWMSLQLTAAERTKLQDIEERILRVQPDSMSFRSSWVDGGLDVWLDGETQFYSADKTLLQERPKIEADTIVRALVTLSELSYAKTEFGALWRVEQMWMPRARFVFDDHEEPPLNDADHHDAGIDDKLPSRSRAPRHDAPEPTPAEEPEV